MSLVLDRPSAESSFAYEVLLYLPDSSRIIEIVQWCQRYALALSEHYNYYYLEPNPRYPDQDLVCFRFESHKWALLFRLEFAG